MAGAHLTLSAGSLKFQYVSDSKYGFDRTNTELIINILMEAEQPRHERIEIFADRKDEVC